MLQRSALKRLSYERLWLVKFICLAFKAKVTILMTFFENKFGLMHQAEEACAVMGKETALATHLFFFTELIKHKLAYPELFKMMTGDKTLKAVVGSREEKEEPDFTAITAAEVATYGFAPLLLAPMLLLCVAGAPR